MSCLIIGAEKWPRFCGESARNLNDLLCTGWGEASAFGIAGCCWALASGTAAAARRTAAAAAAAR